MKYIYVLSILAFTPVCTKGQNVDIDSSSPEWNGIIAGDFYEMPVYKPGIIGTTYLFDSWTSGTIFFYSGQKQENSKINYNLKTEVLEVNNNDEVKVCAPNILKAFKLENGRLFMNNRTFDKSLGVGVSELLFKNKIMLIKKKEMKIKEPNYVPTHDVGVRDKTIVHKDIYYLVENNRAKIIQKKFKKNQELFGDAFAELNKFVTTNKLKMKDESSLLQVIKKYDSLK